MFIHLENSLVVLIEHQARFTGYIQTNYEPHEIAEHDFDNATLVIGRIAKVEANDGIYRITLFPLMPGPTIIDYDKLVYCVQGEISKTGELLKLTEILVYDGPDNVRQDRYIFKAGAEPLKPVAVEQFLDELIAVFSRHVENSRVIPYARIRAEIESLHLNSSAVSLA